MNAPEGKDRALFVRCPNGWIERMSGTARVVGDGFCTDFPIPNWPAGQECVTWHGAGPWKFEQGAGADLQAVVIVLPEGLGPPQ